MPKKKKEQHSEEIIDSENSENGAVTEDIEKADPSGEEQAPPDVGAALEDAKISPDEKLELVKAAWEASETKAAEYLNGWQREKAEFSNYKKRVNRDREQYNKDAIGRVVKNYLSVVDDLERALKDRSLEKDNTAWANGIELIYRKLVTTLENDGVFPIDADGQPFDPNLHEAVVQIESEEHESGQIVDVIQTGYMIGERVLRPARVCIAK